VAGGVAAEERGDLVAVATNGHGAPAAAMGARVVIEEEAARGVGANADWCVGAFDEEFGGGTCDGGEKPLEAAFAGDEFQAPAFSAGHEFIMAFGEAKQIVDGLGPAFGEGLFLHEGREDGAYGFAQAKDLQKNGVNGLRLGVEQGMKACGAVGCDDVGVDEEGDEFVPGEVVCGRRGIGEIESEAAGDEARLGVCESHEEPRREAARHNLCYVPYRL
jgi:hypothetical protein